MRVSSYEWHGKRVLVTGGSGFKGAVIAETLRRFGAIVCATVRHQVNPLSAYSLLRLEQNITVFRDIDICNFQQVRDVVNTAQPNVILNVAGVATVPAALRDPLRTVHVNVLGPLHLMEACRGHENVECLDVFSTDHVFGDFLPGELPKGGFDERTPVGLGAPGGPYDSSKAAMELVVRSYYRTFASELPTVFVTRSANVFGPGDTALRRVIPRFIACAKNDKTIPLQYRHNGRQFIWITDVVAGHIKAVSHVSGRAAQTECPLSRLARGSVPTFHFAIDDYGNGKPYLTLEELARLIANLYGAAVDDKLCIDYAPNENEVQALNCAETRNALRWRPETAFGDGIRKIGSWYDARHDRSKLEKLINDEIDTLVDHLQQVEDAADRGLSWVADHAVAPAKADGQLSSAAQ